MIVHSNVTIKLKNKSIILKQLYIFESPLKRICRVGAAFGNEITPHHPPKRKKKRKKGKADQKEVIALWKLFPFNFFPSVGFSKHIYTISMGYMLFILCFKGPQVKIL